MRRSLVPFSELLAEVVDNRGRTCPTAPEGIALIATNCVRNDLLYPSYENLRFVSKDTYDSWFRGHPKPGDLIFVLKGTPGRVCMVPNPVDFCIAQDMVALRVDASKIYPPYLFALLRSNEVQTMIEQMHVGTLIPHFKKGDFDKLLLPVDTNRENQRFIGNLYFNLSQRIDLNRRMGETLEAMAKALFKSWFVDFDPVCAKIEGRWRKDESLPGLPAHLFDHFPNSFENSELGEIPKGWNVAKLGEVIELKYGKALKEEDRQPGQVPVFGSNGIVGLHSERLVDGPGIVVGRKGNPGIVTWSQTDFFPIDTTFYVIPKTAKSILHFLYFALEQQDFAALGSDSAVPGLNRSLALMSTQLIPSTQVLEAFEALAGSLFRRVHKFKEEAQSLSELRDALLPKLVSGELRVSQGKNRLTQEQYA